MLILPNFFDLDLLKLMPNLLINKLMSKKFGSDNQNTSFLHNIFFYECMIRVAIL